MPTDRWLRLEELFVAASARPAECRTAFVVARCGHDSALADELIALLEAAEQSGSFLSVPALEAFARDISRNGWSVTPGEHVGVYVVGRRIGAGGMGEVWQARDERLGRDVAIKFLLPHASESAERVRVFQHEARAAGGLNHPNVLTVHGAGEHDDVPYLVTERLTGESLRSRLDRGALSPEAALDIALQTIRGLAAAHARGIVHRDLKPENLFLAAEGCVKILDFGLATLYDSSEGTRPAATGPDRPTRPLIGTAAYMAPEQLRGEAVDGRADIYAFGLVLFEMLAGRRLAISGHAPGTMIKREDVAGLKRSVPGALGRVLSRCLAEAPAGRFASVQSLEAALAPIAERARLRRQASAFLLQPIVATIVVLAIAAMAFGGWQWRVLTSRQHWASVVAVAEGADQAAHGDPTAAYFTVREALAIAPDDAGLQRLWLDVSGRAGVNSDPAGAEVSIAAYRTPDKWISIGRTPLADVRVPRALLRVRITKEGYQTIEGSMEPPGATYRLDPIRAVPADMVRITGGPSRVPSAGPIDVADFWMGRFEVTNKEFKAFVDQGGYRRQEFWREGFAEGGGLVSRADAMARFRDSTGAPGPAVWRAGTYPEGQDDFPVRGVSWFEAAAYAVFAGGNLPTLHHWYGAAALGRFSDILTVSNFSGVAPAAVGSYQGLGPFGTYDMAGNVKEWSSTATGANRFLLGGAWSEPRYSSADYDARGPFERAPEYGLRLARYDRPLASAVAAAVEIEGLVPDGRTLTPVGDDIFQVFRRQYAYDKTPLNAAVEMADSTDIWVRQIITLDAAGGGERIRAHLFLPRGGAVPYQTIVFFPAADAFTLSSSRDMSLAVVDFILRSGRAVVYPIYKGTYERRFPESAGPHAQRESRVTWSRDLGRTIDYLETRPDIDAGRIGFYGVSAGADAGVILTALEPRLKVAVLQSTGIWGDEAPESDAFNYAPRVTVPTLMLNGRYDFNIPLETAQRPLFRLLGSRPPDKSHVLLEAGHALSLEDVAREALPWLERYLGRAALPGRR